MKQTNKQKPTNFGSEVSKPDGSIAEDMVVLQKGKGAC